MKKIISLLLAAVMILSMAACGSGGSDAAADTVSEIPEDGSYVMDRAVFHSVIIGEHDDGNYWGSIVFSTEGYTEKLEFPTVRPYTITCTGKGGDSLIIHDVSQAENGSVLCIVDLTAQTITVTTSKKGQMVIAPEDSSGLFQNFTVDLDGTGLDTSHVTTMKEMFSDTTTSSLNISSWNTSAVIDMNAMFNFCTVPELDLSGWDTSSLINASGMFCECGALTTLDLSGWNTSGLTDTHYMFASCAELTTVNLSGWDTANITNMNRMFSNCPNLTSLDLTGWSVSENADTECMFISCDQLTALPEWYHE